MSEPERLQKVLARAGFGSRRTCDDLVSRGRVRVNGDVAAVGRKIDPARDEVEVDGVAVDLRPGLVYYVLHKPAGVVTTARDPRRRPTVVDLVPSEPRVFPVGRLDVDTSGLLLLTNDGDFAQRVAHPRHGVAKTYLAQVSGAATRRHVGLLRRGVTLSDGTARADDAKLVSSTGGRSLLEITVHEGRTRMVRRMLEGLGLRVLSLHRTAVGPLRLGRLKPGTYRALRRDEMQRLLGSSPELGT